MWPDKDEIPISAIVHLIMKENTMKRDQIAPLDPLLTCQWICCILMNGQNLNECASVLMNGVLIPFFENLRLWIT